MEKSVVLRPMPSASDRMAAAAKAGCWSSWRTPSLTSRPKLDSMVPPIPEARSFVAKGHDRIDPRRAPRRNVDGQQSREQYDWCDDEQRQEVAPIVARWKRRPQQLAGADACGEP